VPTVTWQQQIETRQEQNRAAFLNRDIDTLSRLWSDDFVVNSPFNRVNDKAQVLELLQKGVIAHSSYEEHVEVMKRSGDIVTVMGHDVVVNPPDTARVRRRFTNIWQATDGSWRLIARHANHAG
jgi:ketosteroid isomerase-like protein